MTVPKIGKNDYFQAAQERLHQARLFVEAEANDDLEFGDCRYAPIVYLAGVAVECMLRAYLWEQDDNWHGKHDLEKLFTASRLQERLRDHLQATDTEEAETTHRVGQLQAGLNTLWDVWRVGLRYASEAVLHRWMRDREVIKASGKGKGAKGSRSDVLRAKTKQLVKAAETIVRVGVDLWT